MIYDEKVISSEGFPFIKELQIIDKFNESGVLDTYYDVRFTNEDILNL